MLLHFQYHDLLYLPKDLCDYQILTLITRLYWSTHYVCIMRTYSLLLIINVSYRVVLNLFTTVSYTNKWGNIQFIIRSCLNITGVKSTTSELNQILPFITFALVWSPHQQRLSFFLHFLAVDIQLKNDISFSLLITELQLKLFINKQEQFVALLKWFVITFKSKDNREVSIPEWVTPLRIYDLNQFFVTGTYILGQCLNFLTDLLIV